MGLFSYFKKKQDLAEERRKSHRWQRIFIAQCEAGEKKSYTTVFNISRTGLGVYLEQPIEAGAQMNITLQHEFVNGAYDSVQINLILPVRVIWLKEIDPSEKEYPGLEEKRYRAGLELLPLSRELEEQFNGLLDKIELTEKKE